MGLELFYSALQSVTKCLKQILAKVKEVLGRRLNPWRLNEAPRALVATSSSVDRNGTCRLSPDLWGATTCYYCNMQVGVSLVKS